MAGTGSPRKRDDETIVTTTATDGAEANGTALFVFGFEREFNFVNGAGIVFEAAHDGRIDLDAIGLIARRR